jgi:hypothetical protein
MIQSIKKKDFLIYSKKNKKYVKIDNKNHKLKK